MPKRFRRRFEAVDHRELIATYPPPPEYFETHYYMEPEPDHIFVAMRDLVHF